MNHQGERRTADSICVTSAESTRLVHWYVGSGERVSAEIADSVGDFMGNAYAAAVKIGDIRATLRACARGELDTGGDETDKLEPVRTQPTLWELKWSWKKGKKRAEFRMYHAEEVDGIDILALRFHRKDTSGSDDEVERKQDAEMQVAADRLEDPVSVAASWGHTKSACVNCLDVP